MDSSSLSCELRIIKAKNTVTKSSETVFIRCYLFAGKNKSVKLDTQQISSSKSDDHLITWDQTFSLDCLGNQQSIKWLKKETLILELRSRKSTSFIGRVQGSKLIGRADVPWRAFMDSMNAEIEKWVPIVPRNNGRVYDDVIKLSAVQIGMKIEECDKGIIDMERKRIIISEERGDEWCGCRDGGCKSCVDYEFYAIEAALEAL
ncbi:hypothetical protein DH2020_015343 [Rehmannia glutinosa]|uniref:C2 domain-containing protein n=1 Tax=Rehmannia glutinosa TaxID=99300 RepID=A0ABR0WSY0_REHGL